MNETRKLKNRESLEIKKKLSALVLALAMVTTVTVTSGMEAKAATAPWSLRYIHHAESSANVTYWARYLNTTKTTTVMRINKVGGGAEVYACTSNGIAIMGTGTVAAVVPTKANIQIFACAKYSLYGTSNSFPSGSVEY